MCPKYSRRGYLPRNKPLSNRLRVRNIKSKRKASKRSRPTSPPDHPPRRDHPPRAFSHRALSSARDARFLSISEVRPSPSTRPLDLTVHSRVRDPAARPPVMKSSSGLWRHGVRTRFDCAITTAGGGCRGCRHSCARRRDVPPHRSMDPSQAPPFTRDPPPDRPPSRPPPFTISRNLVVQSS